MSNKLAEIGNNIDSRYTAASGIRRQINKVFPTHWSFMLGEIALYSFIILLLTGVYLTLFFDPSITKVIYDGAYLPLNGVEMSRAYETALNLSFEVRGGLFIRQMHHWAALTFMVSMTVHMLRIFFTGAFRRPREANWIIGCVLLFLGMAEGFMGYSLPDDLLSGVGLRIMSAIILALPIIGTWLHWLIFGGDFPSDLMLDRFYIAHVLIIPGIILGLIAAHLALVWYQKHTQFPGAGRTENNVVGVRILPVFILETSSFGLVTFGVLALLAGLTSINAIWNLGPYNPSQVSAGSQPDIYMLWTDGAARVMPAWELYIGNYTIPGAFWVALLCGVLVGLLVGYPFIEKKITGDDAHHNLLQRPRDVPVRTSLGVMAIVFYFLLTLSGGNDLFAYHFEVSLNAMTWVGRIGLIVLPPLAYFITYRICLGLQRSDREVLEHGIETGVIKIMPNGAFVEVHQPLGPVDEHGHPVPLPYAGAPVPKQLNDLGFGGEPGRGGYFTPDNDSLAAKYAEIEHENHLEEMAMYKNLQKNNRAQDGVEED
ncbi:cytochrome bc1 complex cytochrome b subunit [Corynebacterium diphtheriae]|uniref:Cytochrome bc1 complex cytochrome b subunit n=1 Tax=Corynebacterium diphtheriae bv. gravis TaxID=1720349 RepID=A0AAX0J2P2_CORDP|nr:cytochrome bc complex cytochrome b subunit [Corynebacterium diphtheriae]ERA53625.1 ubiquinol-cytochrome C reductase cytochrome B subunit [Corynebacterium diphtheriae DSM 43988]AEX46824.1 ubiquinol-cytochrome C reductase cytochrome B subunit [Corynebacterium diphtheriae INCA 402]AEX67814.1 ubiquinol-cytochrome C reductase cytochrome B subunit [Corynebacterium diphtheriae C7 (beta)]AEX72518.1 ubiquinol-cytochrome C reductase cytochrome B subunit [Corynebacterium diphtheriae CDCE 8392]APM35782